MDVQASINFPHQFIIKNNVHTNFERMINDWCCENCKSMWLITGNITMKIYAPININNPFNNGAFEPSNKIIHGILIAFESEDEAMGFKLSFVDSDEK